MLVLSGTGFIAGRSLFPKSDPAKQADRMRADMERAYTERTGLGGAFVSALREMHAALQQPGADPAALWATTAAGNDPDALKGAKLEMIAAAAQSSPTTSAFVKQHAVESPWNFLLPKPEAGKGTAAPATITSGETASLAVLRENYQAAIGSARPQAAETLARGLARCDPALAETWIGTLTDAAERAAALTGAAGGWAEAEPVRATEWVATLPEGPEQDAAAAGFASNAAAANPLMALSWGLQISTREKRMEIMDAALRAAAKRDPEAAKLRIEAATGLEEREKLDYLESLAGYATGAGLAP
ncbi:MAG: hypothetical protein KA004_10875 [Verrucomicrobiales bacterium]|nr:hypothetical protein [Verrucomicrobiales bacterium]